MLTRRSYTLIGAILAPFVPLRLAFKSLGNPAYLSRMSERFGFGRTPAPAALWLHAVSVGEVNAAVPLLKAMAAANPSLAMLVTTTTPTGAEQLARAFPTGLDGRMTHRYAPYDLPVFVNRLLDRLQPSRLIIMETELWPNLIHCASKRGIEVVLANARLSARSARRYGRVPTLTAEMLGKLRIAAQSEDHRERFIRLGAESANAQVCGNLKYDCNLSSAERKLGVDLRREIGAARPVWIIGSSRDGEEGLLLGAFDELRQRHPQLLLIIVPRHPERFDEVERLCRQRGYRVERRSARQNGPSQHAEIYLADTMGELQALYVSADVAFIGGSLNDFGGQNMLEAIVAGTPPVFGPYTSNFVEMTDAVVSGGAGFQVADLAALVACIDRLLADAGLRRQVAEAGEAMAVAGRGATARHIRWIENTAS